jgi:hypothetical protein
MWVTQNQTETEFEFSKIKIKIETIIYFFETQFHLIVKVEAELEPI